MDLNYPLATEPATPAYVLAVLRDQYRQQLQFDSEAEPGIDLTFGSTVDEWRAACDLLPWRDLGRALNETWAIDRPDAEWFAVLEPARSRRLAEVCALIAAHAVRIKIRPARLLGRECRPAGTFLTVRGMLHRAGASVAGLTPSSPLGPYTRRHAHLFLGEVARLAPGALPPVSIRTPIHGLAVCGIFLSFFSLTIGLGLGSIPVAVGSFLLYGLGHATTWYSARHIDPASVEFEGLATFRDLALAIDRAKPN